MNDYKPPRGWETVAVYARFYHIWIIRQKRRTNGIRRSRTVDTKARLQYKGQFGSHNTKEKSDDL